MKFLSVCSGIEAASVAWAPLGWKPWAVSEIDAFPATVLHHHYGTGRPHHMPSPEADGLTQEQRDERSLAITRVAGLPLRTLADGPVNFGDMTAYKEWPDASLDVLCGGTPCQSFSNAGLRAGLDDPRGQLMLTFGAIAARYRPDWLVWENVPGVLSSNGGRDFGAFLGLLGFLGYGFAYRVLDAQFVRVDGHGRAVPQRRNRVFVVGCLGDWRSAAAVLLESGHGARPADPQWFRALRDQCAAAGVPYLFKQWGEWGPDAEAHRTCLGCGRTRAEVGRPHGLCVTCGDTEWDDIDDPNWSYSTMARFGKKAAGRLLDGVEHNGFPEVHRG